MPLENVVRTYQLPTNRLPQKQFTPSQVDIQPIKLQIGRNGSGKTFSKTYSFSMDFYMDASDVEIFP